MFGYKYLILTDLDGTLLKNDGSISPFTLDYVKKLNERDDVLFAFSTGRCWDRAKEIYDQLQLKGFVSCCNGALYHNPHTNTSVYSFLAKPIWEAAFSSDEFCKNLKFGTVFTDKGNFIVEDYPSPAKLLEKIKESQGDVYSIKLFFSQTRTSSDTEDLDKRIRLLKSFDVPPQILVYYMKGRETLDMEINAYRVNKEKSVNFFSNYYVVPPSRILTFGDEQNDLPAAMGSSYFVAVKNALTLVKCNSHKFSEFSNEEDVVVKEVDLFLKKEGLI